MASLSRAIRASWIALVSFRSASMCFLVSSSYLSLQCIREGVRQGRYDAVQEGSVVYGVKVQSAHAITCGRLLPERSAP